MVQILPDAANEPEHDALNPDCDFVQLGAQKPDGPFHSRRVSIAIGPVTTYPLVSTARFLVGLVQLKRFWVIVIVGRRIAQAMAAEVTK